MQEGGDHFAADALTERQLRHRPMEGRADIEHGRELACSLFVVGLCDTIDAREQVEAGAYGR